MGLSFKILLRTPNWIGDHVMAMPFYGALRKYYGNAEITFLVPESLASLDTSEFCNRKWVLSDQERHLGKAFWERARSLRREKFDLGINLPASFSSASFMALSGIKSRIGYYGDANGIFLSGGIKWKGRASGIHKSEIYGELFEYLTSHSFKKKEDSSLLNSSAKVKVQGTIGLRPIVFAPGASISLREWPHFEALLMLIHAEYPTVPLQIVGGKKEMAWNSKLQSLPFPVENLIAKTDLNQLVTLCKNAAVVIANDSGIAHIAASLGGSATVVLFGPGDPAYIRPLGHRVFEARVQNLPCSPCEKPYCRAPYGYQACLQQLKPDAVFEVVKKALASI